MPGLYTLFLLLLLSLLFAVSALAQIENTFPTYQLQVHIHPDRQQLSVAGDVTLPASLSDRDTVYFQLAEQMTNLKMEKVLSNGSTESVSVMQVGNSNQTDLWAAKLSRTLPKGETVSLRFSYSGGDRTAFVFHIGSDGCYGGGSNTAWYPEFGDKEEENGKIVNVAGQENGVGTLEFTVPKGLVVLASGKNTETKTVGDTDVVTFQVSQPTAFAFVANHFIVRRHPGRIPVSLYLLKEDKNADAFVQGIESVVAELEKVNGVFPFPAFAVAEVTDESTEGAGFGGVGFGGFMLSATSFLKNGFNRAFFGHEIGHQWWGNQVTTAGNKGNFFLSEALAQYGSLVCVETAEGPIAAKRYRQDGYPDYIETQCGNGYLQLHATGFDDPLGGVAKDGLLAHELADNKGFLIWSLLADEIGSEQLHMAFQDITKNHAFGNVTLETFLATIEKRAGRKLDWFWNQWLDRTGAPLLDTTWVQSEKQVQITLRQTEPLYRLEVPVQIRYADGSADIVTFSLKTASLVRTLSVKKRVIAVEADPEFRILHYTPVTLATATALKNITTARLSLQQGKETEADVAYQKAFAETSQPDVFGLEFEVHLAKARYALLKKDVQTVRQECIAGLQCVIRPPLRLVRLHGYLLQAATLSKDRDLGSWAAHSLLLQEKQLGQYTVASREAQTYLESVGEMRSSGK